MMQGSSFTFVGAAVVASQKAAAMLGTHPRGNIARPVHRIKSTDRKPDGGAFTVALAVGWTIALVVCQAARGAMDDLPPNLARSAVIEASSVSNEALAAANVADGRISEPGAALGEVGSWAVKGDEAHGRGHIVFRWPKSVRVSHVIYFGRTAWSTGEVFKDYEILADNADKPVAKGTFKQSPGPQHITFDPVQTKSLTIRFLSSYGGANPGAAEIMLFPSHLNESQLARILRFSVNSLFNDHMVIQRGRPLHIWGTAADGERVTVSFRGHEAFSVASGGKWGVELPPVEVGPAGEIRVQSAAGSYVIHDVLAGEVWVASGQSNMEMPVDVRVWPTRYDGVMNAKREVTDGDHPEIRLFFVPRVASYEPKNDAGGQWQVCTPQTVGGFSAVAYFFGRKLHSELKVPIGLIDASWGATYIEPWTAAASLQSEPELSVTAKRMADAFADYRKAKAANPALSSASSQHVPSAPFNGMIYRLTPFRVRGAIWYQGEGNVGDGMLYFHKMQALIDGWRQAWGEGQFPFLYVQLAPYDYGMYKGPKDPYLLPALWEAQTATLSIPNTGMAVTTDISEVRNIHPKDKQDVGLRLALWALKETYGRKDVACCGPLYSHYLVEGERIRVFFHHTDGGLTSRDGRPLTWFQIAGEDRVFHDAEAVVEGETVLVHNSAVRAPLAVPLCLAQAGRTELVQRRQAPRRAVPHRCLETPLKPLPEPTRTIRTIVPRDVPMDEALLCPA